MLGLLGLLPALAWAAASPVGLHQNERTIPVSDNHLPLTSRRISSSNLATRSGRMGKRWLGDNTNVLLNAPQVVEFSAEITVGGKCYNVLVDTGSSDTWLVAPDFTCYNISGTLPVDQSECMFPPGGFDPAHSPDFKNLSYANNFNGLYGGGQDYIGYGGTDTVTLGGLAIHNATMAVVTDAYAAGAGDNYISGFMGLAGPGGTQFFYGTNSTNDSLANSDFYNPLFYQAVKNGLVSPFFSLVLNRPTFAEANNSETVKNLGQLTLGGIPKNVPVTNRQVTVDTQLSALQVDGKKGEFNTGWSTSVDSFNFPGSNKLNTSVASALLDSGTFFIYLPNDIANAYYSQFDPPGQSSEGSYTVACDAKAPPFSVTIAGTVFEVDQRDLVTPAGGGQCISSIIASGEAGQAITILGDKFLYNVVTTYHTDTNKFSITERQSYKSGQMF